MWLSGCLAIKNGILLGYPFVESILSLLPACDEYIISEGYSEDGTWDVLRRLARKHSKIRLLRDEWPQSSQSGSAIAQMQTRVFHQCRGRWVFLLQADEVMPAENLSFLRELCQRRRVWERVLGRRKFHSYRVDMVQVTDNFQRQWFGSSGEDRWAVRLLHNRAGWNRWIRSEGDGWGFGGVGTRLIGTAHLPRPIWHCGYNFPVNIWRKRVNHRRLWTNFEQFDDWIKQAEDNLRRYEAGAMPPLSTANPLQLPELLAPLIGQMEYRVREELLDEAV